MASSEDQEREDEGADDFWDPILDGQKNPLNIIYVAPDLQWTETIAWYGRESL